eukprot:CAMPEP_0183799194 /NCGR_PEP_ID=MMETSP0803_2-20130417/20936_1 /TAXON_ID=195967 /ORGANISM="Crustomastix stigmata, Strain CCMP3273" /LENGTH=50 /DNA_ID=CAMNT_0026043889 /DNA_START=75 /DNA_END=223 /DNA_ORIENTATION=+
MAPVHPRRLVLTWAAILALACALAGCAQALRLPGFDGAHPHPPKKMTLAG